MVESLANSILQLTANTEIILTFDKLLSALSLTSIESEYLSKFFNSIREDLNDLSSTYLKALEQCSSEELVLITKQFKEQLGFFWIELQSEWIRTNNIANFKLTFNQNEDVLIMAKATICSFFLKPIAELLDQETIQQNTAFIKSLLNRAILRDE